MNRKAMGIAQSFVFLVAAFTFVIIMIFGYKAVEDFLDSGEEVVFVQFKNDITRAVTQLSTDFGAKRVHTFTVPAQFNQICFVDLDKEPDQEDLVALSKEDPLAADVWEEAWMRKDNKGYEFADQNVFLTPLNEKALPIKVPVISIIDGKGFLCLPVGKRNFKILMQGKGDHTELAST